ncbi:MAG: LacI family DNA-binding transcriptional regulator, partial [Victivallales bacterium]|nr:LacI family DNA-binding transcriptional regulator [Victivallales bacterium]
GKVLYVGHATSSESRIKYDEIHQTLQMMGRPLDFIVDDFMETPYNSPLVDRHHGMCYAEENLEKLLQYKLIISTDLTALGICDALRRHNIVPGEDIFLAGIDNLEGICHTPDPFLTTIDQGYGQLGTSAGNGMIAAIATGIIQEHELINQATFIRRKSF